MERLTEKCWRNLDPWELCGDDCRCDRECRFNDEYREKCNTLHLYRRVAEYEDAGLEPAEVKLAVAALMGQELAQIVEINDVPLSRLIELARAEKDNAPLTLEELREMIGEPVWVETPGIREYGRYGIVESVDAECNALFLSADFSCHDYGKNWLPYRRKPENSQ